MGDIRLSQELPHVEALPEDLRGHAAFDAAEAHPLLVYASARGRYGHGRPRQVSFVGARHPPAPNQPVPSGAQLPFVVAPAGEGLCQHFRAVFVALPPHGLAVELRLGGRERQGGFQVPRLGFSTMRR